MAGHFVTLAMFLLFIAFPIAEIAILISVGGQIGVLATLAIVIGTAVVGTTLLRAQGFGVLARVQDTMMRGEVPVVPAMEGMFLLLAGAFLLTPGLITDTIGIVLLIPPLRTLIAKFVLSRMVRHGALKFGFGRQPPEWTERTQAPPRGDGKTGAYRGPRDMGSGGTVIDGDFERLDDETIDPKSPRR